MIQDIAGWGLPVVLRQMVDVLNASAGADDRILFGSTEHITIQQPPFPDPDDAVGEYIIPDNHVELYRGARLLGSEDPLALARSGTPIRHVARNLAFEELRQLRDAGRQIGWSLLAKELLAPNWKGLNLEVDETFETLIPLTRRDPEMNYYHWITEFLPRLRGVEVVCEKWGCDPIILIEPNPPSWVSESLALVDIPSEDYVEWTYDKIAVDQLVVPRYNRKAFPTPFEPSRADLVWVRERLLAAAPNTEEMCSRRLFVSRQDADERRLKNHDEIVDVVTDHGFEVVVPTELTVEEQVSTYRSADIVLGPHGAGLTNVLFADDATLIELFPRDYTPIYFFMIADMFDLDYECLIGDDATPDFTISPTAVNELLARVTS